MTKSNPIYSDEIQVKLECLSNERLEKICDIACKNETQSDFDLYKLIATDGTILAIDSELIRVLREFSNSNGNVTL